MNKFLSFKNTDEFLERVMEIIVIFVAFIAILSVTNNVISVLPIKQNNEFCGEIRYAVIILFAIVVFRKQFVTQCKSLFENKKKLLLLIFCATVLSCFLSSIVSFLVLSITGTHSENQLALQKNTPFLQIIFLAPIVEEIIFRAGIHRGLCTLFNKVFKKDGFVFASILSSAFFAFMHLIPTITAHNWINLLWFIPYFIMGFCFAFVYNKSNNNVVVSSAVHILSNATATFI